MFLNISLTLNFLLLILLNASVSKVLFYFFIPFPNDILSWLSHRCVYG